jgi:hypothetical protein
MSTGPVFVFSLHRSGGTLLMRLLNCHPGLVIWGEHGGIINQFVEMDEILKLHRHLNPLAGNSEKLAEFVNNEGDGLNSFTPWAGPLTTPIFHEATRKFLHESFSRGLKPGQRWGFKEIRYHKPQTAAFLFDLFPNGQIILLQRELIDAAISNILAPWSLRLVTQENGEVDETLAIKIIEDVAYGLLAFEHAFKEIKAKFPRRTTEIEYAALRDDGISAITRVSQFLNLPITPEVEDDWTKTLSAKLGTTNKKAKSGNILNRDFIERHLNEVMPRLREEFAEEGLRPLLSWPAQRQRRYAAMLGDHEVKNTSYTTVF